MVINNLVAILNLALHYATNGQENWQTLRNNSFNVNPSSFTNVDAKNLFNLSKMIYGTYLNHGNRPPTKVSGSQIETWNNSLSQSKAFLNLSQLNPTGTIAQKMPGNLKDNILQQLRLLAQYNPVSTQQQQR
ncbi:MAG: hypothetical protein ACREBJ_04025 [Nitrosotalea sp.]